MSSRPLLLALLFASLLAVAEVAVAGRWPASQDQLPTTDGAIYLGNLDQRIVVLDALYQRKPDAATAASLAGAYYHRYRIRGALADAERAFVLADAALAADKPDPGHFVLRATLRSGFHRFAEATADLDAAQALGVPADKLSASRRDIAMSRGEYGVLRGSVDSTASHKDRDFDALAFDAHLRELHGDATGAGELYARAQDAYADSSPVPLAWLYVQQGAALLEAGHPQQAQPFFAAAHARLPGYTLATEHLAETEALLGNPGRARVLYRDAIAASEDPAFIDALARLEQQAGNKVVAARLARHARQGWEARITKHPAAFAGHAVDYFLDHDDPRRALTLARENLELRRDIDSLVLLARAADAAGDLQQACATWHEARATGLSPPRLRELAGLGQRCR
jgi:hypothetical protein